MGWDIDAHDETADPELNFQYALTKYKQLRGLGLHPLLEDSNGSGGYHVWTIFDTQIHGTNAFSFGRWLVRDLDAIRAKPEEERTKNEQRLATLTVEVFPKQQSLEKGGFGNQLRLPGKHHKRNHWSRIWEGTKWLEGRDAAEYILSLPLSSSEKIPSSARSYVPPKPSSPPAAALGATASVTGEEWWKHYSGDLKTLDILTLCEDRLTGSVSGGAHEIICPWCDEHTTGDGGAFVWEAEDDKWPGFHCHHAHCKDRQLADLLGFYGVEKVDQTCADAFRETTTADLDELGRMVDAVLNGGVFGEGQRRRGSGQSEDPANSPGLHD